MLSVAGCAPAVPIVDQPTEEPLVDTPVSPVLEVTTPSPIPEALPTVLLITGTEVDPFMVSQSEDMLEKLAEEASMQFAKLEGLEPEMLTPEVKVVVGVGQDLDLNTLAVNYPGIAFVAIGSATASVADNVSVIGNPAVETRQKAFMAGYLSAITSSDNKIAALIAEENPARDLLAESYEVGARFFCGICHQVFPPYGTFPQWEAVSTSTLANDFRAIIDQYSKSCMWMAIWLHPNYLLTWKRLASKWSAIAVRTYLEVTGSAQSPSIQPRHWKPSGRTSLRQGLASRFQH